MHPVPVPINVRCYSNSDVIVGRSEVTLRAKTGHRCRKIFNLRDVSEIALLRPEIAFLRPIARRRLP